MSWVLFNTVYHHIIGFFRSDEIKTESSKKSKASGILVNRDISIISSLRALFEVLDPESETIQRSLIDWYKMTIITMGTFSHILICLDTPISYYTMDRHERLLRGFGNYWSAMINEHGFSTLSSLSGFGTFAILWPIAQSHKIRMIPAILDRWIKYLPPLVCVTCLEFLWPTFSSGPFWTRVADAFSKKCHKNYWLNFFFVNNWISSFDIVSYHLWPSDHNFLLSCSARATRTTFQSTFNSSSSD